MLKFGKYICNIHCFSRADIKGYMIDSDQRPDSIGVHSLKSAPGLDGWITSWTSILRIYPSCCSVSLVVKVILLYTSKNICLDLTKCCQCTTLCDKVCQ